MWKYIGYKEVHKNMRKYIKKVWNNIETVRMFI